MTERKAALAGGGDEVHVQRHTQRSIKSQPHLERFLAHLTKKADGAAPAAIVASQPKAGQRDAGGAGGAGAVGAAKGRKLTADEAGYVPPPGKEFRCGNCAHYMGGSAQTGHCALVQGFGGIVHTKACCNQFSVDGTLSTTYASGAECKSILDW